MARFLGAFPTSRTFFVKTTSMIGSNGFLLCEVTFTATTSLSWNGWFHFTASASKLVSGSVLGVFGSMVHSLVNSFYPIWRSTYVCETVVLRSLRRGNTVSWKIFSCEARECHHVRKNFGGGQLPGLPVPGSGPGDSYTFLRVCLFTSSRLKIATFLRHANSRS